MKKLIQSPLKLFRKLYDWTKHWSKTKQAPYALFCIAFIESSFFPIPPDVLLIAMVVSDRKKWLRNALICTIGSVLGAMLGYLIGLVFYETIGKTIVNSYNLQEVVAIVGRKYSENAFLTVFTAAFTPIPYKVITIAAGLFRISLPTLIIASIIGRAGRFFLVSASLRMFGKKIEDSIEKYFDIFSLIFIIFLVGGFIFLKCLSK